jgi:hypothetical protein
VTKSSVCNRSVEAELESWSGFADALRAEDRELFREMIDVCRRYAVEIEAAERPVTAEAVFMTVLLVQHKTIRWLQRQLRKPR